MKTKKRPLDLTIEECREFSFSDLGVGGGGQWKRISGEEGKDEVSCKTICLKNLVVKSRAGIE